MENKNDINRILGFDPNNEQIDAINSISAFCREANHDDAIILKGSAGTGKTSIIKAISKKLWDNGIRIIMMAPTGRASKILKEKTCFPARTIHSEIYTPEQLENGAIRLHKKTNESQAYTIYFVDESSMISDNKKSSDSFITDDSLLKDLIIYVKQGNNKNKIVFIGDKFQLPPINEDFSPALTKEYLRSTYKLVCNEIELTKVMRQADGSGILDMATKLRDHMIKGFSEYNGLNISTAGYSTYAMERYLRHYNPDDITAVTVICGANKNVDTWNNWIRERLGLANETISKGDFIVTQQSHINSDGQFIYKGEFGKITDCGIKDEEYAGFKFRDVEIEFISMGEKIKSRSKILMDSLNTKYGKMGYDDERKLYAEVMKHNKRFRETKDRRDDKYLSALRIKYGYASTCHKAQGGEWKNVLIHPWKLGKDLPWTYTAITRATESVYTYRKSA